MPKIKIEYYGIFSDIAQKKQEELDLNGGMIKDLVSILSTQYGKRFEGSIFNAGMVKQPNVLILKDGRPAALEDTLQEGVTIMFMTAIAGG